MIPLRAQVGRCGKKSGEDKAPVLFHQGSFAIPPGFAFVDAMDVMDLQNNYKNNDRRFSP